MRSAAPGAVGRLALEAIFPETESSGRSGMFDLRQSSGWLTGQAAIPAGGDLESDTRRLYRDLLRIARGRDLCRIWNLVPDINGIDPDGLERYRRFSRARSQEFEREFGPDYRQRLPAASAVGHDSGEIVVGFAAAAGTPVHKENPRQVPAYDYPSDHGPRSPSFSRATVMAAGGQSDVFISGTAAIVGHVSVAPGDTRRQLDCTLENLQAISRECGLGSDLGAGRAAARHFSVYLRFPGDEAEVRPILQSRLLGAEDSVAYSRADICRAELNVEIEATIRGVRAG